MNATITKRVDITHDLWKIWIKGEDSFNFRPGQYCTIGYGGVERPYSIVSAPHESEIELFLELVPPQTGVLTPTLFRLQPGAQLQMRPRAKGIFVLKENYVNHLMVATVTGIAPYVSMLRQYLTRATSSHKFFVLVGASFKNEFAYNVELQSIAEERPNLLKFIPTISRPDEMTNEGWNGETGRVNTIVEKYIDLFNLEQASTLVYACGHPSMISSVRASANNMGFAFQEERFWKSDE
ncbi:MAG: ferredoxin--NADP+ reductase [Chloroflexi bacterium]|jgi:NAD(P)H-flavin reductase|nr:MAG: ferredoxin--NADP+ reductase [Chloroflexota bacterium]